MARNHKVDADAVLARVHQEGPEARVTRGEALALLDLLRPGERGYQRRKAMGNKLDRARRKDCEPVTPMSIDLQPDCRYVVSDLARWASANYQLPFAELPRRAGGVAMTVKLSDSASAGDQLKSESYPGTLEQCHVAMRQLYTTIRALRREMADKGKENRRELVERFSKGKK